MTTEGKVSPLPWRVDPQHRADIQTVDGRELATLWNEEAVGMTLIIRGVMAAKDDADGAANAAFIIRAVNAHDRLVAAIERFIAAANDSCDASHGHNDVAAILEYNTAFTELSAALAAAKGGK